jgi:2-C-methyl-D-erythritol 4-phosphate cytidylyltransferase
LNTDRYLVIVAGGKGLRMGMDTPKQFLLVKGKPILMHTLERFIGSGISLPIILVIPEDQIKYWEQLCLTYNFDRTTLKVVAGGLSRDASVKNGLNELANDGIVGIHDGVRPLVSTDLIERAYRTAELTGSGIPAVALKESIRQKIDREWKHQDRALFQVIQTPQCFSVAKLKEAYGSVDSSKYTDDAAVYEAAGHPIVLVEGEYSNIKITTESDLPLLEYWLSKEKK